MRSLCLALLAVLVVVSCKQHEGEKITMSWDTVPKPIVNAHQISAPLFALDSTVGGNISDDLNDHIRKTLSFIDSFDASHLRYRQDTFDIFGLSTEGCQVVVVQDTQTNNSRMSGTCFGEMGKEEFTYYLSGKNDALQMISAVTVDTRYDRPMYQKGMRYASVQKEYQIYGNNQLLAVLDKKRRRQTATDNELRTKEDELRGSFKDLAGEMTAGNKR